MTDGLTVTRIERRHQPARPLVTFETRAYVVRGTTNPGSRRTSFALAKGNCVRLESRQSAKIQWHPRELLSKTKDLRETFSSLMILPQVHLRKPCYDFCPVQATAIKAVSTDAKSRKTRHQRSPLFSKRLSPGQRRAVCTKGRDVISVS